MNKFLKGESRFDTLTTRAFAVAWLSQATKSQAATVLCLTWLSTKVKHKGRRKLTNVKIYEMFQ